MVQLDATSAKPSTNKPPCQNRPFSVNQEDEPSDGVEPVEASAHGQ